MSLIDFRLRHVQADLRLLIPDADLELWPEVTPVMTKVDNFIVYDVNYYLTAQDAKGHKTVDFSATFTMVFDPAREYGDEDLEAFGSIGALSVAHPYVRELFHSLTSRMGLPPLLLEVMPPEPDVS